MRRGGPDTMSTRRSSGAEASNGPSPSNASASSSRASAGTVTRPVRRRATSHANAPPWFKPTACVRVNSMPSASTASASVSSIRSSSRVNQPAIA